jgi:hypothetical protein
MACIAVNRMNRPQTTLLFILSKTIKDAREAAAPTSNPIARETASHVGFDNLKKSTTWMVEIIDTKRYKVTKEPIIK